MRGVFRQSVLSIRVAAAAVVLLIPVAGFAQGADSAREPYVVGSTVDPSELNSLGIEISGFNLDRSGEASENDRRVQTSAGAEALPSGRRVQVLFFSQPWCPSCYRKVPMLGRLNDWLSSCRNSSGDSVAGLAEVVPRSFECYFENEFRNADGEEALDCSAPGAWSDSRRTEAPSYGRGDGEDISESNIVNHWGQRRHPMIMSRSEFDENPGLHDNAKALLARRRAADPDDPLVARVESVLDQPDTLYRRFGITGSTSYPQMVVIVDGEVRFSGPPGDAAAAFGASPAESEETALRRMFRQHMGDEASCDPVE